MEFLVRNSQNNTVSLLEGVYQLNACLSLIRLHRKQPFYCGQSDGILIISTYFTGFGRNPRGVFFCFVLFCFHQLNVENHRVGKYVFNTTLIFVTWVSVNRFVLETFSVERKSIIESWCCTVLQGQ